MPEGSATRPASGLVPVLLERLTKVVRVGSAFTAVAKTVRTVRPNATLAKFAFIETLPWIPGAGNALDPEKAHYTLFASCPL